MRGQDRRPHNVVGLLVFFACPRCTVRWPEETLQARSKPVMTLHRHREALAERSLHGQAWVCTRTQVLVKQAERDEFQLALAIASHPSDEADQGAYSSRSC